MTWDVIEWGFEMKLAKEVAVLITRHLKAYLSRLCTHPIPPNTLFAVHPGGPKILLHVQELLQLRDDQMRFSFQVLKNTGICLQRLSPTFGIKYCGSFDPLTYPRHKPCLRAGP